MDTNFPSPKLPYEKPKLTKLVDGITSIEQKEIAVEKEIRTPVYLENGLDNWLEFAKLNTFNRKDDYGRTRENEEAREKNNAWLLNKSPLLYCLNTLAYGRGQFNHDNDWGGRAKTQIRLFKENIQKIENWKKENDCPIEDFDSLLLLHTENETANYSIIFYPEIMPSYLEPFQKYIKNIEHELGEKEVNNIRDTVHQIITKASSEHEKHKCASEIEEFVQEKMSSIPKMKDLLEDASNAVESFMKKDIPSKLVTIYCDLIKYHNICSLWGQEHDVKSLPPQVNLVGDLFDEIQTESRLNRRMIIPDYIEEIIKEKGINKEVIDSFDYKYLTRANYERNYEINVQNEVNINNIPAPNEIFILLTAALSRAIDQNWEYTKKSGQKQEIIKVNNMQSSNGVIIRFQCFPDESIDTLKSIFEYFHYLSNLKKWDIEWRKVDSEHVEIKIWHE